MKYNKNNNKTNNKLNIKKFLMVFFMALFCSSQAYSMTANFDQGENALNLKTASKGNLFADTHSGATDTPEIFLTNSTQVFDYKHVFSDLNEPFFITIENFVENQTYTISWSSNLLQDDILNIQNITFTEAGKYVVFFEPQDISEQSVLYVDMVIPQGGQPIQFFGLSYQEVKPETFSAIVGGLVQAFISIVEINTNIWLLLYYVLIFALALGGLFILFGIAFAIFTFARKLGEKKRKGGIMFDLGKDD